MKTALTQLEDWIEKFEKVNGTPTICEIKAQIDMFKEVEKEQIITSHFIGQKVNKGLFGFRSESQKYYQENFY